ncbi:MAG: hypothetical protein K2Q14_04525 [Gammaproteobacteria bacterium]|nr:hypothetical protein [Gammaproteobacteria bacterium]
MKDVNVAVLTDLNDVLVEAARFASDLQQCISVQNWSPNNYDAAFAELTQRVEWIKAYLNAHPKDNLLVGTKDTWKKTSQDNHEVDEAYCHLSSVNLATSFDAVNEHFQENVGVYGGLTEQLRASEDAPNVLQESYKKMKRMLTAIYAGYNSKTEENWADQGDAIQNELDERVLNLRDMERAEQERLRVQQAEQVRRNAQLAEELGPDFVMEQTVTFGLDDFPHKVWNLFQPVLDINSDPRAAKKTLFINNCNEFIKIKHPKPADAANNPLEIRSIERIEKELAGQNNAPAQIMRGLKIVTHDGVSHEVYVNKDGIKAQGAANLVPAVFAVMALAAKKQVDAILAHADPDDRERLCAKKIIEITQKGAQVQQLIEASLALIDQGLIPQLPASLTAEQKAEITNTLFNDDFLSEAQKRALAEAYQSLSMDTKLNLPADCWMQKIAEVSNQIIADDMGIEFRNANIVDSEEESDEDNDNDIEEENDEEAENENDKEDELNNNGNNDSAGKNNDDVDMSHRNNSNNNVLGNEQRRQNKSLIKSKTGSKNDNKSLADKSYPSSNTNNKKFSYLFNYDDNSPPVSYKKKNDQDDQNGQDGQNDKCRIRPNN